MLLLEIEDCVPSSKPLTHQRSAEPWGGLKRATRIVYPVALFVNSKF